MRLVCPNCEAKYEVPEDAIPETGRDVQCANCGHAWFQMRSRPAATETAPVQPVQEPQAAVGPVANDQVVEPSAAVAETVAAAPEPEPEPEPEPLPAEEPAARAEPAMEPDSAVAELSEPVVEPEPHAVAEDSRLDEPAGVAASAVAADVIEAAVPDANDAVPAQETAAHQDAGMLPELPEEPAQPDAPTPDPAALAEDNDDLTPEAPAVAAAAAAYAVDESVLAILREEAEREAKARLAEAAKPLETQTDLGIDQAMPAAARLRDTAADDPSLTARRARLPDVEEINSTLRPSEAAIDDNQAVPMPVEAEGRSSFRSGFLLVLTVAILGSAVYGSADMLAELVPALAGPLKSYVSFVDSLRLQLDGLMQSATVAINGS